MMKPWEVNDMLINELCRRCGLTKKAVEYYIEQGLVRPGAMGNGYREFTPADAERLERVAVLRRLGLSAAEIRRCFAEPHTAMQDIAARRSMELDAARERQRLLKALADTGDYAAARSGLAALERRQSILERLLSAFPGPYGRYLSLHFGRFLTEPIQSDVQLAAFERVTAFLDNVNFHLPEELQALLDESAVAMDAEFVESLHASMEHAVSDPCGYIAENREQLEAYMAYTQSGEYLSSPAYRLKQALMQLSCWNGYYEEFIPAMAELSPAYREYREGLARADEVFRSEFGGPD